MDDECFQAKWTFKDEMGIQVEIYSKQKEKEVGVQGKW